MRLHTTLGVAAAAAVFSLAAARGDTSSGDTAAAATATPRSVVARGAALAPRALPSAQQEAEVRAAIDRIFEGMRTADSAMVRSVFAEGARFALLDTRDGDTRLVFMPVDRWIEAIAGSGGRWDERIYDVDLKVDKDMASAWTPYTFYLDGAVRHCGVNSIELLRTPSGWKVTQLSDTRSTSDCPDPLGG